MLWGTEEEGDILIEEPTIVAPVSTNQDIVESQERTYRSTKHDESGYAHMVDLEECDCATSERFLYVPDSGEYLSEYIVTLEEHPEFYWDEEAEEYYGYTAEMDESTPDERVYELQEGERERMEPGDELKVQVLRTGGIQISCPGNEAGISFEPPAPEADSDRSMAENSYFHADRLMICMATGGPCSSFEFAAE